MSERPTVRIELDPYELTIVLAALTHIEVWPEEVSAFAEAVGKRIAFQADRAGFAVPDSLSRIIHEHQLKR